MIDVSSAHAPAADPVCVGQALVARFTGGVPEPIADSSVRGWVNLLTARLTPVQACSVAEHLFGVLPLIDAFFESGEARLAAVASGAAMGSLGLFTPTPDGGWCAAMIGESAGRGLRVSGEVRIASPDSDGSIVLVRLHDGDQRLAWLDHHASGVEQRGSRSGRPPNPHSPRWLSIDGATIIDAHVSRPVGLEPDGELHERLDRYAVAWSLVALEYARATLRSLRRAARTTRVRGHSEPFSATQVIAMDLGELEIETDLTQFAGKHHCAQKASQSSGLVLALAAARVLESVAAKAKELRDHLGLRVDSPLTDPGIATVLAAYLGGAPTIENELARVLDVACASGR